MSVDKDDVLVDKRRRTGVAAGSIMPRRDRYIRGNLILICADSSTG